MKFNKQEFTNDVMLESPQRYVQFLKSIYMPIKYSENLIEFKKGEFVAISEVYGYPSSATVVKNGAAVSLQDLQTNHGLNIKVFVEQKSKNILLEKENELVSRQTIQVICGECSHVWFASNRSFDCPSCGSDEVDRVPQ